MYVAHVLHYCMLFVCGASLANHPVYAEHHPHDKARMDGWIDGWMNGLALAVWFQGRPCRVGRALASDLRLLVFVVVCVVLCCVVLRLVACLICQCNSTKDAQGETDDADNDADDGTLGVDDAVAVQTPTHRMGGHREENRRRTRREGGGAGAAGSQQPLTEPLLLSSGGEDDISDSDPYAHYGGRRKTSGGASRGRRRDRCVGCVILGLVGCGLVVARFVRPKTTPTCTACRVHSLVVGPRCGGARMFVRVPPLPLQREYEPERAHTHELQYVLYALKYAPWWC